ncbi:signal peptide protein [Brevibacillus panacihumi W25]|uniref:Diguanylate cyclase DosC n=1 Tax=Brevibacillus panacihumi W25 TaxID=1408254 RepID=V6M1S1_9BACL|nr:EAL domain-containing protein [Brevibacillus panacihumi]EST52307.1 signal peptide protein [Brevibacillus panacihumi W25]
MSNDHHIFAQQDEQRNVIENSGSIAIAGNAEMILQMNMIQLTEEDLSLISAFRPIIITRIEQITSSFYESILRVDKLKEIITKHTTVERLRLTLSNHVIEMFSGKIDEAFIQKRLKIALVHQKIGLPPKWYMGAFQNLQSTLLRIAHDMQNELPHYDRFIQAITKLLSFEQQLVLEAYEEKTREVEQKAKEIVEYQAHHDELTGLPNRRMFQNVLREAIARNEKKQTKFAVLMLDIDRFKLINDSLGHTYGDQFLQEVSQRLLACTEGYQASVARMGGDEFTLICEECPNRGAVTRLAENLVAAIEVPYHLKQNDFYVSASVGIAVYPDHGTNEEELLQKADQAMYEVKKNGKNGYRFFTSELDEHLHTKIELEADLRKAIQRQELVLYYQPQIQAGSNKMIGVEALARWNHPVKGILSPGVFIPIAEETGMIYEIGTWTLREACRQMREWHLAGGPLIPVSVNLSSQQFHQPNLIDYIREILAETGLEPKYLELEITESMMMDAKVSKSILQELDEFGVKISLDDFGTGYSSLSYLKQFPIHKLKIDRSFIADITKNVNDQAIVATIISMAKNLKMDVIAEGIETKDQLEFLTRNSCEEIQGYYFSRPLPAPQVEAAFFIPQRKEKNK